MRIILLLVCGLLASAAMGDTFIACPANTAIAVTPGHPNSWHLKSEIQDTAGIFSVHGDKSDMSAPAITDEVTASSPLIVEVIPQQDNPKMIQLKCRYVATNNAPLIIEPNSLLALADQNNASHTATWTDNHCYTLASTPEVCSVLAL